MTHSMATKRAQVPSSNAGGRRWRSGARHDRGCNSRLHGGHAHTCKRITVHNLDRRDTQIGGRPGRLERRSGRGSRGHGVSGTGVLAARMVACNNRKFSVPSSLSGVRDLMSSRSMMDPTLNQRTRARAAREQAPQASDKEPQENLSSRLFADQLHFLCDSFFISSPVFDHHVHDVRGRVQIHLYVLLCLNQSCFLRCCRCALDCFEFVEPRVIFHHFFVDGHFPA